MFDIGQKVICVRKKPWILSVGPALSCTPSFGEEVTVDAVLPQGAEIIGADRSFTIAEDGVVLAEYPQAIFDAKWFRPKEPNIEALRSLITSLPAKQPEEEVVDADGER